MSVLYAYNLSQLINLRNLNYSNFLCAITAFSIKKHFGCFRDAFISGSIFGKRALLANDHIMLALFWSYVPNMK